MKDILAVAGAVYLVMSLLFAGYIAWYFYKEHRSVRAVGRIAITYIGKAGSMERYRASWNPSPSAFVEKHELRGLVGASGDAVLVADLPSSAFEATFDVAEGSVCDVYLRTYGDNGTFADSGHAHFTARNEQTVSPVEDFGVAWLSHIP